MIIYTHPSLPGFYKEASAINNLVGRRINSIKEYLEFGFPETLLLGASKVALSYRSEIQFLGLMQEATLGSSVEDIRKVFPFLRYKSDFDIAFHTFETALCVDRVRMFLSTIQKSPNFNISAGFAEEDNEVWTITHDAEFSHRIQIEIYDDSAFNLRVLRNDMDSPLRPSTSGIEMVTEKVLFHKAAQDDRQYQIVETLPSCEVLEHPLPLHLLDPNELRALADHMERVDEVLLIPLPATLDDTQPITGDQFSFVGCDTQFSDYRGVVTVRDKGVIIRANQKQYLIPENQFKDLKASNELVGLLRNIKSKA